MAVSALHPGASPDSPYAIEMRRSPGILRFSPRVEREFVLTQLRQSRTLVRVACSFTLVLVLLRGAEITATGGWHPILLTDFLLILAGATLLAAMAWTGAFERHYVPWASVIVPLRNAIIAAHVAHIAASGQTEMLMVLPLMMIGPFFFLGLRFRTALICGVAALLTFVVAALAFGLPATVAGRAVALMSLGLAACAIAARHIELWSRNSFLQTRMMEELAQIDGLTGTKNRRVFDEHLQRLWAEAVENRHTMALLLIDVDHFKDYNDRYGHQAGDGVLRQVAQTVQEFVRRPLDILARYGGEEFTAVLYGVEVGDATQTAERMRRAVEMLGIEHAGSRTASRVTVSIGVAVIEPVRGRDWRGALQLADQALYEAKVRGRNRVELMNEAQYRTLVTGVFSREHV